MTEQAVRPVRTAAVRPARPRRTPLVGVVLAAALALTGCGAGGGDARPAASGGASGAAAGASGAAGPAGATEPAATGPSVTKLGVRVTGSFGARPRLDVVGAQVPSGVQVVELTGGKGAAVRSGDLLVAGFHVQTWGDERTPSVVLDDSWDRRLPALTVVGSGSTAWDTVVDGRRLGSRLLVVVPGADGWKAGDPADAGPRAVVVDLVDVVTAGAKGRAVARRPAKGFPTVSGAPGKAPKVSGLTSVVVPDKPASRLLVAGTGAPVGRSGTLVVHLLQVDVTTGRTVNTTWGRTPKLMPAAGVLSQVSALGDARLGSRAVALLPGTATTHPQVLVVDVLEQV